MRWNEAEVAAMAQKSPEVRKSRVNKGMQIQLAVVVFQWEGKLLYKAPASSHRGLAAAVAKASSGGGGNSGDEYKERWFRLKANCLFYWKTFRPSFGTEPLGVLVLEGCHVQQEGFVTSASTSSSVVHAFSIFYGDDGHAKKHLFICDNQRHLQQWISAIRRGSYEHLRQKLIGLQIRILNKSGKDPLIGTGFEKNPIYNTSLPITRRSAPPPPTTATDPRPKPRKAKSTFRSHVTESWESHNHHLGAADGDVEEAEEVSTRRKPTFQSHVKNVPEGNLIDF